MEGLLMGDQDHSAEVVPYIVDTCYELLKTTALEALASLLLGFHLPLFFTCDKDQSKMR
jgi:hypothetical protein